MIKHIRMEETVVESDFFKDKPACVVLCGGKGSRIFPLSLKTQKAMLKVGSKPILQHVIEYWQQYTDNFIFVVKHQKEEIIEFVRTLPIKSRFVEPKKIKGLADALCYVENMVGESFLVVLGDCICKGEFKFPKDMEQGVGVYPTKNKEAIARSYSIELSGDGTKIKKVEEKPKIIPNNLCGMGFYFLNKRIFGYISKYKSSTDDLTTILQYMIEAGEKKRPVFFEGKYLNITFPHDMEEAEKILS